MLQQKIARFISNQPRSDEGVHVSIIARAIGKEGDAEKIRSEQQFGKCGSNANSRDSDALDKLMDEGLVYSTIDDSHFNIST